MEAWQTILLAFGGNAALLAVVGLLGKSLLEKVIARDTRRYESELKMSTDAAVERLRNDLMRSVESYKVQLKKSEFLFTKEFEAASAFTVLVRAIYPRLNRPDMDWHDAYTEIAKAFERIEEQLHKFLTSYGPVLHDEERSLLWTAFSHASDGKFHDIEDPQTVHAAELLWKTLEDLEAGLIKRVRDQSSL